MIRDQYHRFILNALFLIGLYFFFWIVIDPKLIYHGGGIIRGFPVFFFGWDFLSAHLARPGGMVYYLSAFFSQFLYISCIGALIIAIQILFFTLFFDALLKKVDAANLRWLRFAPGFILMLLYSGYSYHFTSSLALLFAFFITWIYLSRPFQSKLKAAIVFTLLALITYWIAGAAFFVFAISTLLYAGAMQKRILFTLYCMSLMLLLPYVAGTLMVDMNPADAYRIATPLYWQEQLYQHACLNLALLFYLILPGCFLVLALKPYFNRLSIPPSAILPSAIKKFQPAGWITMPAGIITLLGTGYLIYSISFNHTIKRTITVDYHAYHNQWHQVLIHATGNINDTYVTAAINRALYHTHQFGDYMPLWQKPEQLLLMGSEHANAYWYKFDLYLDLGFINMAQHNLNEALEFYGEQPLLLKRLALIHLIKGNIGTARIYLNQLRKTMIYDTWADTCLQALNEDPPLLKTREVMSYRRIMLDKNDPFPFSMRQLFRDLLAKNSHNRMAFEYWMALLLLTKDFEGFMENLHYLKNFNYPAVPRLYQQALLVITSNPEKSYDIPPIAFNNETIELYNKFFQIINQHRDDPQKSIDILKEKYSNNYFFYCLTH